VVKQLEQEIKDLDPSTKKTAELYSLDLQAAGQD